MPEGIKAGELFIDLGIEGGAKTVGTLTAARKGMGEVASVSLEAKAGILAAVYGLERLIQTSSQLGNTLTNFKALTGVNTSVVQQYMYAARQMGVANEDVLGSFKALQNSIAQIDINKGLPEGMKYISNVIHGFDVKKLHDLPYMMQQFQKFALDPRVNEGVKRWALGTVGLSEGMITAMERNAFRPEVFAQAPQYSEKELQNLQQIGVAWSNLGNKVEMAFGRINAHHGGRLVKDIDKVATATLHLVEILTRLSEKGDVFGRLGSSLEGMANTLKLVTELVDKLSGKESKPGDILYREPGEERELLPGWKGSPVQKFLSGVFERKGTGLQGMLNDLGLPGNIIAAPRIAGPAQAGSNKVDVHQNITHIGDAKDTRGVRDLHKKAAQAERTHAYRQSGANLQGN